MNMYLIIFLTAVISLAGCTAGPRESDAPAGDVKRFDIVARNWDFTPDEIRVNQGDTVLISLTSIDDGSGVGHGIAFPAFGVNKVIREGQEVEIEFVADKKGTFPFICSIFCGAGHSDMKGRLVVE